MRGISAQIGKRQGEAGPSCRRHRETAHSAGVDYPDRSPTEVTAGTPGKGAFKQSSQWRPSDRRPSGYSSRRHRGGRNRRLLIPIQVGEVLAKAQKKIDLKARSATRSTPAPLFATSRRSVTRWDGGKRLRVRNINVRNRPPHPPPPPPTLMAQACRPGPASRDTSGIERPRLLGSGTSTLDLDQECRHATPARYARDDRLAMDLTWARSRGHHRSRHREQRAASELG